MEETTLTTSRGLNSVRCRTTKALLVVMSSCSLGAGVRAAAAADRPSASMLTVEPAALALSSIDTRQQLAVTLRSPDGSLRDVTRVCRIDVEPAGLATISS